MDGQRYNRLTEQADGGASVRAESRWSEIVIAIPASAIDALREALDVATPQLSDAWRARHADHLPHEITDWLTAHGIEHSKPFVDLSGIEDYF